MRAKIVLVMLDNLIITLNDLIILAGCGSGSNIAKNQQPAVIAEIYGSGTFAFIGAASTPAPAPPSSSPSLPSRPDCRWTPFKTQNQ